jgi:folate-binding protein YgfZ
MSQDLDAVADGSSAWSWLLAPNGKVDALVRMSRVAADRWVIDTDGGWGEAVVTRLSRFKLRTKVDIEASPWKVIGLRGDGWEVAGRPDLVVVAAWPGVAGVDVLGPAESALEAASGLLIDPAAYEPVRILAGIPRLGRELTEKTIPAETGLIDMTVSFTKGCYTGQELVARIDSRGGNVPRHLRSLRLEGAVEPGTELLQGEQTVGFVTSAALSAHDGWVGLGYVRRGVEPPVQLQAGLNGPRVDVEVRPG